jgi:hypothetical protein
VHKELKFGPALFPAGCCSVVFAQKSDGGAFDIKFVHGKGLSKTTEILNPTLRGGLDPRRHAYAATTSLNQQLLFRLCAMRKHSPANNCAFPPLAMRQNFAELQLTNNN